MAGLLFVDSVIKHFMKYLVVIISMLLCQYSFGKGSFPGVDYSYVKVYLFNVESLEKERPDSYIYRDGAYAKTKVGEGVLVSESKVNALNKIMSGDINTLLIGLSKCFIPRHGFVYYNEKDEPVASVSVCFECEAVRVWSQKGLRNKPNYDKISVAKAEKQIIHIKDNIIEGLLPVFKELGKYSEFVKSEETVVNQGEMTLTREDTLKSFVSKLYADSIKKWNKSGVEFNIDHDVEISAGGDEYKFKTFELGTVTKFLFYDNSKNPLLAEAVIVSSEVLLPNGLHVGASLDEVMNTFGVYDGIAYPEIINLETKGLKISYHFENNTLIKINLYVYQ